MVARAHKLKPSASSSLLPPPLLSTAPPSPAAFVRPPSRTTLHPSFRPSLRRPLWCPPNQPHPCPSPRSSLRRLPLVPRATPFCLPRLSTHSVRETARCRTHRVTLPRVPTPPLPGRLQSSPAARQPPLACLPACRPTPLRFARLRALGLFSLPTAVPVTAPFSCPPCPPPRDARRHPLRATSTPESRALWNTTGSSAIIFCPIVCRACMRAGGRERGEREKACVREPRFTQ